MNIPPFEKFVRNPVTRLLAFDPGETTGYSFWENSVLEKSGQLTTHTVKSSVNYLDQFIEVHDPRVIVIEEYRVYAHKTEDHAQDNMHTSRLIGCMETLCVQRGIPYRMQGAGIVKTFCNDEKLKGWGFWKVGERHARDAIRHGAYFLIAGKQL